MKKCTFLIIGLFLIVLSSRAQDLTCSDFKTGKFYIPQSEELREYTVAFRDSIIKFMPEKDSTANRYIVVRSERTQTEWKNGINQGSPRHEIIEWIDECSYRLTFDEAKSIMDEEMKWINDNNGIVVSKLQIEEKCMIYDATMTTTEGHIISQKGIICKE
ncbi:MAG: hypothetical protein V7724_18415 [Sediminicola sp.]